MKVGKYDTNDAKLEQLDNGKWLATDLDGKQWVCDRKPFNNGLGTWFVKLKINENYEDVMRMVKE
ncbi:hypothetical protein LO80_03405 [Candidatus Francisella endociliophora]|uniref:Uncharacterized protein n=2 Tax=Candidatus Francisella endociliophora TaxID=653937 RepID=A0A097ENG4_9GAMM|nr:hypothetical protein LO80_03405 [Francisella sp. FSC1006]